MKKVINIVFLIGDILVFGYSLARIICGIGNGSDYIYMFLALACGALAIIKYVKNE